MKKYIYTLICLFLGAAASAQTLSSAQAPYSGETGVQITPLHIDAEQIVVRVEFDLDRLALTRQEMVVFAPELVSEEGKTSLALEPVSVAGKRRAKVLRRQAHLSEDQDKTASRYFYTVAPGDRREAIQVEYEIPFEPWMRNSRMVVAERAFGCAVCDDYGRFVKNYQTERLFPAEPYSPVFQVAYMNPPAEEMKIREETHSARLHFPVNKSVLLRSFGDNARILAEADEIIERIKTDDLLTIRRITVKGYASPEGDVTNNMRLSEERAQAFVNYLHNRHNYHKSDGVIVARGMGEDWDGLRRAVEVSGMDDRYRVTDIIDNTFDRAQRKRAIRALSGGRTYQYMLMDLYPPLRRNEYTIEYKVRGLTAEEAFRTMHTRPKLLSLNEFYLAAEMFERGSEEFRQTFDLAARVYPDSPIARINVAAIEIEKGMYKTAAAKLEGLDSSEAMNNLGVAFWHIGDYPKAEEYLSKASDAGSREAVHNLEEYAKWMERR